MKRAAAVAVIRVSSDKQVDGTSLAGQRETIQTWADENSTDIIKWIEEPGKSASYKTAAALQRGRPEFWLWVSAPPKKYDYLLFLNESRFSRSNIALSGYVETVARGNGIKIVSVSEPELADEDAEELVRTFRRKANNMQSKSIGKLSHDGVVRMAQAGSRAGGVSPYGYERAVFHENGDPYIENGEHLILRNGRLKPLKNLLVRLIPHPVESVIVGRVFSLYHSGRGCKQIARILNDDGLRRRSGATWDHTTIWYLLRDPNYTGSTVYRATKDESTWVTTPNTHQPLCTQEQYEFARQKLGRTFTKRETRHSDRYLLNGGIMRCTCGANMRGLNRGGKNPNGSPRNRPKYICSGWSNKLTTCDGGYLAVDAQRVEEQIVKTIRQSVTDPRVLKRAEQMLSSQHAGVRQIETALKDVDARTQRLIDAIEQCGVSVELKQRLDALRHERGVLQGRLASERQREKSPEIAVKQWAKMHDGLLSDNRQTLHETIRELLAEPIVVDPKLKKVSLKIGVLMVASPRGFEPLSAP